MRQLPKWLLPIVVSGIFALVAAGQTTQPATAPAGGWELSPEVRAALEKTEDCVFNVDQPGFYAVLEAVKRSPRSPGFSQTPILVDDWRDLLERPADFRGRVVTIEGIVGRNKSPYKLLQRPELGWFWQLELRRDDQPLACSVVLTEDAADIPLNASVKVSGYFVMIRQYYGPSNRVQQAALVVAPGPTLISRAAPRSAGTGGGLDWRWMAGAVVLGVVITLLLLWRSAGRGRRDLQTLRASHTAPLHLADDLETWAADEQADLETRD
ncbi:MAG: hypothetical protein KAY37_16410 [Phycisphaerae bacterium]|nr:hypothetical protein [Phycisphaerae bacterium]